MVTLDIGKFAVWNKTHLDEPRSNKNIVVGFKVLTAVSPDDGGSKDL
jgi:hypothetical protein